MSTVNTISGRSAFLSLLKDEGVTHLFGNPGTTELPIMHALKDHMDLTYVLGLQESIVVAMADGFSRSTGRLTACNVHVAPGLGNAMGSLYNANFTGTPLIISAGQQEQGHGLTEPLLYAPLVPIAEPVVKWAVEVNRLEDMPRIIRRAAKIALTPPTGPVFLSLPGDILNAEAGLELGSRTRVDTTSRPTDEILDTLADRFLAAKQPMILCGQEVVDSDAFEQAAAFAEALGAPVYQQTVPYGAHFPSEHPAFMGALTRNQSQVRGTLEAHDLLICLGADVLRMSVWSEDEPLPANMRVIQLGLNDWEMGKNYPAEMAVRSDVKETLRALLPVLERKGGEAQAASARQNLAALADRNWTAKRASLSAGIESSADTTPIDPDWLMARIVENLPPDAIVVDEGIISSQKLLQFLPFRDRHSYFGLASGGIGWAIAGAIGVQLAHPERRVTAVIGDGSAMYSIQALWTAAHLKLPITYVIANNGGYRIIKQRLLAFHDNDQFIGMDFRDPEIGFAELAQSLGMPGHRISDPDDVAPALRQASETPGPTLLELMVQGHVTR